MQQALVRHDTLLREAIEAHGGHIFKTVGDQFCAAFAAAPEALAAALAVQQALLAEPWPAETPLRVRMAPNDCNGTQQSAGDPVSRPRLLQRYW